MSVCVSMCALRVHVCVPLLPMRTHALEQGRPSPSCLLAFPVWPWSSFLLHPLLAWSSDTSCPLLKKESAGDWQWGSENWPALEGAPSWLCTCPVHGLATIPPD